MWKPIDGNGGDTKSRGCRLSRKDANLENLENTASPNIYVPEVLEIAYCTIASSRV